MTLLDAPKFDEKAAKRNRQVYIGALAAFVVVILLYVLLWTTVFHSFEFWAWPGEHRLGSFMKTVEAGDFNQAYAMWNNDPNWEQHKEKYSAYDFDQFNKDWGPMGDYGKIHSHELVMAKSYGNGVVVGIYINGGKKPLFMRVDDKTKQIGFSPVELYVGP